MVPPNRLIPLPGSGAILQIHPLEDGVFAVLFLDPQHGLLDLPLPGVGGRVCLLLLFLCGVVGEQIHLLCRLLFPDAGLVQQLVGADAQPADQQIPVYNPVVEGGDRPQQVMGGGGIEVYLVTSIGPIPFATMVNREWGNTGQNYLRSLLALGFQAFLIMICVGIYAVLVEGISLSGDNISGAIWGCMGYTVLLCFTLFKTGSLAKSLFGAH